jgi:AraC-like DNA-binding protein
LVYLCHNPRPPLSAIIKCFWYSEGFVGSHARERLLPSGESSIIFDLRQAPICIFDGISSSLLQAFPPAIFAGARTSCFVIETSAQERVLGIQFRPGGAFPVLGLPANEVAQDSFSLGDVWPRDAQRIRERVLDAAGPAAMFAILEQELTLRLQRGPALHRAVAFAVQRLAAGLRVGEVADEAGLSSRRLGDLFEQQTGLAPKAFQRVRRFQRVLQRMYRTQQEPSASLAADCGYFDQAHFIHDFRAFSGMTPSQYAVAATPHLNHVPIG